MIESAQIESVSVPVGDQDRAKGFYVGTLGFELLVDDTWREGMRWSEVVPEGSATSLMLVTWSACMLPGMYRVIDRRRAVEERSVPRTFLYAVDDGKESSLPNNEQPDWSMRRLQ
jgi:catechol 2,3-dioxygenase-like lactoylglutathione lyase family enzyme